MRTGIPAMPNAAIRLQVSASPQEIRTSCAEFQLSPNSAVRIPNCEVLPCTSIKELCARGVTTAATGRWSAATSHFCGPQFHRMWRDVEWHRGLTARMHASDAPVV